MFGDALVTGDGRAVGATFADVARAVGADAIFACTGIEETAIFEALTDPDRPQLELQRLLTRRILESRL